MPLRPLRSHAERAFVLLLALVYLSVFPYLQGLNNPNENARVYLTMALVDHRTFHLDDEVRRYGWTNDLARVPAGDGTSWYACPKGPLVSLLGVPVYALQRAVFRLAGRHPPAASAPAAEASAWLRTTTLWLQLGVVHLPALLLLRTLVRRLRRLCPDPSLRLTAIAALALGTNYLAYSLLFCSHALSGVAAFLALDLVARARLAALARPDRVRPAVALLAGLLAGSCTLLEYQGAVLSVILGLYGLSLFRSPRLRLAFAAGALIDVAVLLVFQRASFGSAWSTGVLHMENPAFRATWQQGFLGFTAPSAGALRGLWWGEGYGLFRASPWLLLGLLGALALPWLGAARRGDEGRRAAWVRRERAAQAGVAVAMVLALTALIASGSMWRGGWTIGPRYLGAAPALLLLPALGLLAGLARRWPAEPLRVASAALALASFAQLGLVSLLVTTLPESIDRPLAQIAAPFLRLGLVPHHLLEPLGVGAAWPWYLIALAAVTTLVVAALASAATLPRRLGRVSAALALSALLVVPSLRPRPDPAGAEARALFYSLWEPRGRDRLARARAEAERDACRQREVARLERVLGREREAAAAEQRAQACEAPGAAGP